MSQLLLHIWAAIEALFPRVSTEVSFRVALYLSQRTSPEEGRLSYLKRIQSAYRIRNAVAHGTSDSIRHDQWVDAWELLLGAVRSVIRSRGLPTEDQLLSELLT